MTFETEHPRDGYELPPDYPHFEPTGYDWIFEALAAVFIGLGALSLLL